MALFTGESSQSKLLVRIGLLVNTLVLIILDHKLDCLVRLTTLIDSLWFKKVLFALNA